MKKRASKAIPAGRSYGSLFAAMEDHPQGELIVEYRQWRAARAQVESPGTPADLRELLRDGLPEIEAALGRKLLLAGPRAHATVAKLAAGPRRQQSFRAQVRADLLMSYERLGVVRYPLVERLGVITKKRLEAATWTRFEARGYKVARDDFRIEFSRALKATGLDKLPKARRST